MLHRWIGLNESGRRIGQEHPRAKYTDTEVEQVLILARLGKSTSEIAKKMGMPTRTVRAYIRGEYRAQAAAKWVCEEF